MVHQRERLIELLQAVIGKIDAETDTVWSKYANADELLGELRRIVARITENDGITAEELELLFAPTGSLQVIAMDNGWSDDFMKFAQEFDRIGSRT